MEFLSEKNLKRQNGSHKKTRKSVTGGLHNLGISKKSSGTYSDCDPRRKFWTAQKYFYKGKSGQIITIRVPASVSKTFAIAYVPA